MHRNNLCVRGKLYSLYFELHYSAIAAIKYICKCLKLHSMCVYPKALVMMVAYLRLIYGYRGKCTYKSQGTFPPHQSGICILCSYQPTIYTQDTKKCGFHVASSISAVYRQTRVDHIKQLNATKRNSRWVDKKKIL